MNVGKLYLFCFFQHLIFAYVIERLFWEERGMTIQLVVYTEIIYALTIVLLEIPTGIAADRFGRKPLIVFSAFLGCFEFLLLIYATEFWHFAFVVFLTGIGNAASSGSINALLYDSLLRNNQEEQFEKIVGRLYALSTLSALLAALCGGWLASQYGFTLNYWLSLISTLLALLISLTLTEPEQTNPFKKPLQIGEALKTSIAFFQYRQNVLLVLLSGMIVGATINYIDEFWQLYLKEIGIPIVTFGLFSAMMMLLRLPGNLIAYRLKGIINYRTLLTCVIGVIACGFFYIASASDWTGLIAMLFICLVSAIIEPLTTGYLHHQIDGPLRATLDSFQSFGENILVILLGLGFGFCATRWEIFGGYGFLGCICTLFLGYFWFTARIHLKA